MVMEQELAKRIARYKDGVFTRASYGKNSRPTHRPPVTPSRTKAVFWGLVVLAASTYTLITATGLDYPRPNILHWIMRTEDEDRKKEDDQMQVPHDPMGEVEWEELQRLRVRRVNQACDTFNLTQSLSAVVKKHLLVDTKHKAVLCFVPKVACTSWKRVWFWLSGVLDDDDDVMELSRVTVHGPNLPSLASYRFTADRKEEILRTFKKFLFVRHPMDRLISAYRDKLEGEDVESTFDFHKHVGQEVERMVRGKVMGEGHNVTFSEFVQWATPINGTWTAAQQNEHWRPVYELCAPCHVKYDAIGKYENLQEEVNSTLHWMGAGEYSDRFPPPDRPSHANRHHKRYLRKLSPNDRLRFLRTYLLDFLLFGYNMA